MESPVERLVVGLGNPGPEYEGTRHNAGFQVLDVVAEKGRLLFGSSRSLAGYSGPRAFSCARFERFDALLVKPQTFMNLSGDVVAPLLDWAGLGPERLLVVFDDLDLPLGRLRIRPFGGHGGHNGMRSIVDSIGSDRFPRLRVGIGSARTDAARHVLARFAPDEQEEIAVSAAQATDAILDWLGSGDIERCMTRFHSRWNQGRGDEARTNEEETR